MPNSLSSIQQVLLAAVVVGVLGICVREFSRRAELRQLSITVQEQYDAVSIIQQRIQSQYESQSVSSVSLASPSEKYSGSVGDTNAVTEKDATLVESFAEVLAVFQAHAVVCVGASEYEVASSKQKSQIPQYQILLSGDFRNVLEAMETLKVQQPNSMVFQLSMNRSDLSLPCEWELVFGFSEPIQ